jgi:hypothetical protein
VTARDATLIDAFERGQSIAPTPIEELAADLDFESGPVRVDHLIDYRTVDLEAREADHRPTRSSSSSTPSAGIHRRGTSFIQDRKNIGNVLLPP